MICGRARKKIKAIEAATHTSIYFPPTFPKVHLYCPEGATRRSQDEIVITGGSDQNIADAKNTLNDMVKGQKTFAKDIRITPTKVDHLLQERLDKLQSIMEAHSSYLVFPSIGQQMNCIRAQGLDVLNVERSIRDVMGLVSKTYWLFLLMANHP